MIYKLKHKPTGMYFQPHKHRGSHLSKKGKIYQNTVHGLTSAFKDPNRIHFRVACENDSHIYKQTKDILNWEKSKWSHGQLETETLISDWEIEEIK